MGDAEIQAYYLASKDGLNNPSTRSNFSSVQSPEEYETEMECRNLTTLEGHPTVFISAASRPGLRAWPIESWLYANAIPGWGKDKLAVLPRLRVSSIVGYVLTLKLGYLTPQQFPN